MIWGTVAIIAGLVSLIWLVVRMDRRRSQRHGIVLRDSRGVEYVALDLLPNERQVTVRLRGGGWVTLYRKQP